MTNRLFVPSLKDTFLESFRIGAAVHEGLLNDRKEFITEHFNSLTAENSMKFENLQPAEGEFDFTAGDRIVQFAKENGMSVRGHTLIWHAQTPEWVFYEDAEKKNLASKELLKARMAAHINTVVAHYQDSILCWDVVNEAIEDKGSTRLRHSLWSEIMGEEFIDYAFRLAHEANPAAQLFYNDYNESSPSKSAKIFETISGLLEREVPVHGVGLQAHWNVNAPSLDDIKRAIEKYASLGLRLHITEMDVSVFDFEDKNSSLLKPTEALLELQAERYEAFFKIFKSYRAHIDSVTFWGVDDAYTWLDNFPVHSRKNWPFLFDTESMPKPAFWRVIKTIEE